MSRQSTSGGYLKYNRHVPNPVDADGSTFDIMMARGNQHGNEQQIREMKIG